MDKPIVKQYQFDKVQTKDGQIKYLIDGSEVAAVYWKENEYSSDQAKEYQRRFRKANPLYGKNNHLKKMYGVDLDWYNTQSKKQNHLCAICGQPENAIIHGKKISLAVDHCHDTGKVRGLLCRKCNNAIGAFKHDKYIIQQAIKYLEDSNFLETFNAMHD
jgi:hypothetical protein